MPLVGVYVFSANSSEQRASQKMLVAVTGESTVYCYIPPMLWFVSKEKGKKQKKIF